MHNTVFKGIGFTVAMALSATGVTAVAVDNPTGSEAATIHQATSQIGAQSNVVMTDDGISINGVFYTRQEFTEALQHAILISTSPSEGISTRAAVAVGAGIYFVPGIGQVVIAATGAIIVAGLVVVAGTWAWNAVTNYLAERDNQILARIRGSIPSSLRKSNGDVDLSKFTTRLKNGQGWRAPNGWKIDKNRDGRKGGKWKLKDKKDRRVATLREDGEVVGG
ncbi:hypothetical protein HMPREF0580_1098 [Mobiluncus mulieris ATCC 35239]|uniref:Tat pathway signal sequence domain protein n=2 Tax=Mobiluncus mulieris TaxID=2052 RepID=E0QQD3_9ACTO|nr:hypothetical protein [Mobiluncus mulieris]EFM46236.1 hypothetical protein HMPREF0580_1098 [Mobiluncus mulieris ATCC 35239]EFN92589.1 hypothetical protein HMPREF9278_1957 [Mobiluncus mulieris FB024-16]MBB5846464.1 hypothetical protein [Mobiluncus mulieris]MCU9970551.1 hypothetical protein [Mobiluncus mulieris]MCU9975461.1 hypothetical protein [Mobiluncus mulieris]